MYKLIWRIFGKKLVKFYLSEHNKPLSHSDLQYAFTLEDGKRYYRFASLMAMSVPREGKVQEFFMHLSSGMDPNNVTAILDEMEKALEDGIKDPKKKSAAKIGALIQYMRDRVAKVLPVELCYNILAVQYVREDEHPQVYDEQIQLEKVAQFKEETERSSAFFFNMPELQILRNLLGISESQLKQSFNDSQAITKTVLEIPKIFKPSKDES